MKKSKKLKRLMAVILAVSMMFSVFTITSFAATEDEANSQVAGEFYTSGDFEYNVLDDDTAIITEYTGKSTDVEIPSEIDGYTVTSIGDSAFYNCTSLTNVTIPDSVTSIGGAAFSGCTSLASVTIPDSVTSIDDSAFYNCTSLTNVTIPNSVTSIGGAAFSGCTSLASVTIPDSVTSIGSYAFDNCTSLTNVTIPDSVTNIGDSAFYNCTSLTSINVDNENQYYCSVDGVLFSKDKTVLIKYPAGSTLKTYSIPNSVTSIGDSAFRGCTSLTNVTIPDSVTSIGDSAFYNCTSLESITIPDSVTSIDWGAFSGCTNLASVTIPDSVTSIGGAAFSGCTSLTNVTIPDSVTSIDDSAFYNCTSLTNVTIPNSVTSIGYSAFENCTNLANVTIPDSVTNIGNYAFDNCTSLESIKVDNKNQNYCSVDCVLFNKDKTVLIKYPAGSTLKTYSIPDGVTSIGNYAFENCTGLVSVTIPDGVTRLGGFTFTDCTSLESITIPDGVTDLGYMTFDGCTSLKNVTIPESVTEIYRMTFANCTSLESIVIPKNVSFISNGNDVFYGCTSLKSLSVDSNNENYYSVDNALYSKIDNSLMYYPEALDIENVDLPSGVKKITPVSFQNCNVKSVNLPDTVTEIMYAAFQNCSSLAYVNIPESVKSIGTPYNGGTFLNCESLKAVTIPSSVEAIGPESFGYLSSYDDETGEYVSKTVDNFTIYGKSGSAAETYANNNKFTFVDLDNKSYSHADKTSGIQVVAKADAELSVTKISDKQSFDDVKLLIEKDESILSMYDISLLKDGNKVQHEGMAEVKIPCSDENAKVYRLESDNTLTDMNAVYKDGNLYFYTEHFSKYVVAGQKGCIYGDANGDGAINAKDRMTLTRYLAKWSGYENIDMTAADVNNDSEVNAKDRMILTRHLAKWQGYETLPFDK